jgi:hypothetical protein
MKFSLFILSYKLIIKFVYLWALFGNRVGVGFVTFHHHFPKIINIKIL